MAAGTHDIYVDQGATFRMRLTLKNPDTTEIDLTGYSARMQIRQRVQDAEPIVAIDSEEAGGITLGGADGTIDILITDEQTSTITARRSVYDIEIESTGGEVTRVLQGKVFLSREVTR